MLIAICDDDRLWNKQATELLRDFFSKRNETVEVVCFENGEQLLSYEGPPISAIFMDIEFDGASEPSSRTDSERQGRDLSKPKQDNGIEIVRKIENMWEGCHIVYCTNYLQYALDVYETGHVYYVMKSQFKERLEAVFARIYHEEMKDKTQVFFHVIGKGLTGFFLKDIQYLERRTRHTVINTLDGCYSIRERIPEIMEIIPNHIFTRCHSSYLVMMDSICQKEKNTYRLKSGVIIPISRNYMKSSRDEFLRWCEKQMR